MAAGTAAAGAPAGQSPLRHFMYVTSALTATEFKLRYFGSVLGYLWTVLRPLMLFGVLYVVFTHVVSSAARCRTTRWCCSPAIVVFNFFSEATSGGLGSLVARENLLRKVSFPRAAVPISVSLTAAANLVLGILVVFGFALIDGVELTAGWLGFVLCVAFVVAFATAGRSCCRCCSSATATCSRSGRLRSSCSSGERRSSTRSSR